MYEQVQKRNDYSGNNLLGAGYISANLPINARIDLYAGIRYEYTKMEMIGNTRDDVESHRSMIGGLQLANHTSQFLVYFRKVLEILSQICSKYAEIGLAAAIYQN